jgi:hypothetical protein
MKTRNKVLLTIGLIVGVFGLMALSYYSGYANGYIYSANQHKALVNELCSLTWDLTDLFNQLANKVGGIDNIPRAECMLS